MILSMTLLSRYIIVNSKESILELEKMMERPESLRGLLILLDSNTILKGKTSTKYNKLACYLISESKKMGLNIIVVTNNIRSIDKRVLRQVEGRVGMFTEVMEKVRIK